LSTGVIQWADEMRYLGVFITRSCSFKCSLEYAKKSYYRAANAIFATSSSAIADRPRCRVV